MKQIKDLKIGLPSPKTQDDATSPPKKVEPKILEDGTKVWPKVERRKVRFFFFFLSISPGALALFGGGARQCD